MCVVMKTKNSLRAGNVVLFKTVPHFDNREEP